MDIGNLGGEEEIQAEMHFKDGMYVTLRHLGRKKITRLFKPITKLKKIKGILHEDTDPIQAALVIGKAAIVGWRGATANGQDFEYNDANRDMMMTQHGEFSDFIVEKCDDLDAFAAEVQEGREKKS